MSLQRSLLSCDLCNLRGMVRTHLEGNEVMLLCGPKSW